MQGTSAGRNARLRLFSEVPNPCRGLEYCDHDRFGNLIQEFHKTLVSIACLLKAGDEKEHSALEAIILSEPLLFIR